MKKVIHKIRQHPAVRKFATATEHHRLTVALAIFVVAALVLTGVSVGMYYMGGFYRFDLSRPDFAVERTEIAKPEPQKEYDTTSPVTKSSITDFLTEFDNRQKDLRAYGDFRDQSLGDEDLQITSSSVQPQ
jgi:hypothetical protein